MGENASWVCGVDDVKEVPDINQAFLRADIGGGARSFSG